MYHVFPFKGETDDSQVTHLGTEIYTLLITIGDTTITDRKANLLREIARAYNFSIASICHN